MQSVALAFRRIVGLPACGKFPAQLRGGIAAELGVSHAVDGRRMTPICSGSHPSLAPPFLRATQQQIDHHAAIRRMEV